MAKARVQTEAQPQLHQQLKLPGRKPTHRVYRVAGDGMNAHWTQIGAAWPHGDGKGFSIALDAIPLTGRLVLRSIEPMPEVDA